MGNFPEVIEDAHQRCYKPFIETLYAYPDFRFAAHFSGWLLDWLRERHPANMALLAEMVARGQVELFSSGDTEPVLAAIPGASVLDLGEHAIRSTSWDDLEVVTHHRSFLAEPRRYLRHVIDDLDA